MNAAINHVDGCADTVSYGDPPLLRAACPHKELALTQSTNRQEGLAPAKCYRGGKPARHPIFLLA
ncbi:hypothetical protein A6U98_08935 [Rhizobium sp. WYCCWR10014]|nr:hypothetical protein A6U98_08935 [Rhizobium sp. WYCCWR10014]